MPRHDGAGVAQVRLECGLGLVLGQPSAIWVRQRRCKITTGLAHDAIVVRAEPIERTADVDAMIGRASGMLA